MKWTRNILSLLVISALCVGEISAQTTSSAAQVVTFGVRRIVLQAPAASYVANTMNQNPVKVTAGSQSQFQAAVDFRTTTADQAFSSEQLAMIAGVGNPRSMSAAREWDLYTSKSPITKSVPSDKLLVTLTE